MSNKNQPQSLSIISAVVFIVLLIGLGIYTSQKGKKTDDTKKTTTSYKLKSTDSITVGKADSTVTFIEYYDYECPACQYLDKEIMPTLIKEYKDKVKFVFRQFPLSQHEKAKPAAYAAVCANEQGKFLEYNDILVKDYEKWTKDTNLFEDYAKQVNLDTATFNTCRNSKEVVEFVKKDIAAGTKDQLQATPTVFINGEKSEGVQDLAFYRNKFDTLLKK